MNEANRPLFTLLMSEGPQAGRCFPFYRETIYLGRREDNDLVLDDPLVSRHHALISSKGGQFFIEDLGSINGTFLNNEEITAPQRLHDGDIIGLGDVELLFRAGEHIPAEALEGEKEKSAPWPLRAHLGLITFLILLIGATVWFGFILPRAGPEVYLTSPADGGEVIEGEEVLLFATAHDRKGLTRLELWVDGELYHSVLTPEGQSLFHTRLTWEAAAPGHHTLTVKAYNTAGNSRTSAPITVKVVPRLEPAPE